MLAVDRLVDFVEWILRDQCKKGETAYLQRIVNIQPIHGLQKGVQVWVRRISYDEKL